MSKFVTFDAPTQVAGRVDVPQASPDDFGAGVGVAAGEGLRKFALSLRDSEQRADVSRINTLQATAMSDLSQVVQDLETNAELGAPEFVKSVTEAVTGYYETRGDQATTSLGKQRFAEQQAKVLAHFTTEAIKFQAASAGTKVKEDHKQSINNFQNALLKDPGALGAVLQMNAAAIDDPEGIFAKFLNAEDRVDLKRSNAEDLIRFAVRGAIRINPDAVKQALINGTFDEFVVDGETLGNLDSEDVQGLIGEANMMINANEAALKAEAQKIEAQLKRDREAAQQEFYGIISTGRDAEGRVWTDAELIQAINANLFLKPYGVGSKTDMINTIRLRAKGRDTIEMDAAELREKREFISILYTGKDLAGNPRTTEYAVKALVTNKTLSPEGTAGVLALLDRFLPKDAGGAAATAARKKSEREINDLIFKLGEAGAKTTDEIRVLVKAATNLDPVVGLGSQRAFLARLDAYDVEVTKETRERELRDFEVDAVAILETGKTSAGVVTSLTELRRRVVVQPGLTYMLRTNLLERIDAELDEDEEAAKTERAAEYFQMIMTQRDSTDKVLTRGQIQERILTDDVLDDQGDERSKQSLIQFSQTVAATEQAEGVAYRADALYDAMFLHENDPKHIGVEELASRDTARSVGFPIADRLLLIAQRLEDKTTAKVERAKKKFLDRFKSTITSTTITHLDKSGDRRFGAFVEEVDRQVAAAEAAEEDPMVLFSDVKGNSKYLGLLLKGESYMPGLEEQIESSGQAAMRQPFNLIRGDPTSGNAGHKKAGETPEEFLIRMGEK
tara:strand:- start:60 stop:2429 length:2370 start_codon:yes stop_codon:yes gene_type:complete